MIQEPNRPTQPRETVLRYFNARDRKRDGVADGLRHILRILDSNRPEAVMAAHVVVNDMLEELRGEA